jgi:hypothetical protein
MSSSARRLSFAILFVAGMTSPLIARAVMVRFAPATNEMQRVTSPDWRHDAVVVRRQPALSFLRASTEVYVVPRGSKIARGAQPVMLASKAEGVQSVWRDDRLLEIRYSQARVERFTAVWPSSTKQAPSVEIRLTPSGSQLFAPEYGSVQHPPR